MKRLILIATSLALLASLPGCATKVYGRVNALANWEKELMNCRTIDNDLAKTRTFVDYVNKESEFSGRDVMAILGDLGIGNRIEKKEALESANKRIDALVELRATKQCPAKPA